MNGYAVIDVETTGLRPGWRDRIVEIGLVLVSPDGEITGEWVTLVNANRDLGPQGIHGITAADMRHAPTFAQLGAALVGMLSGRVVVAHNLAFDAMFIEAELRRAGLDIPVERFGLCTMALAAQYLPTSPRGLVACCEAIGATVSAHHNALADARAAAELLRHYLTVAAHPVPWSALLTDSAAWPWPPAPHTSVPTVERGISATRDQHFLTRIVDRLPRVPEPPRADAYLQILDNVLLDRHISVREADDLVAIAARWGLDRPTLDRLHREYLTALAAAAWTDGVVTDTEREDLYAIATALRIPPAEATEILHNAAGKASTYTPFRLPPGSQVVFTGEMAEPRTTWEDRAREAGLIPRDRVTKDVRLLIAADPDTLSGKARRAHRFGIPIVTPEAFRRLLNPK